MNPLKHESIGVIYLQTVTIDMDCCRCQLMCACVVCLVCSWQCCSMGYEIMERSTQAVVVSRDLGFESSTEFLLGSLILSFHDGTASATCDC